MYYDSSCRFKFGESNAMSANRNINEQRLNFLNEKLVWLRVRLEATAHEIQLLDGEIPKPDERFQESINEEIRDLDKELLLNNKWVDKIIAVLNEPSCPCTVKEIAEIIYGNEPRYSQSTIYTKVNATLLQLTKIGVVSKKHFNPRKWILN